MGKHKPPAREKGKGSQLVIRIEKAERETFVSLCERLDTSAAREIRRFIRGFISAHPDAAAPLPGNPEVAPAIPEFQTEPEKPRKKGRRAPVV